MKRFPKHLWEEVLQEAWSHAGWESGNRWIDHSTSCFLPLLHCWTECHLIISALLLLLSWVSPPFSRGQLYRTVQITRPHGTDSAFPRAEQFSQNVLLASYTLALTASFLFSGIRWFLYKGNTLPSFQNIRLLCATEYMLLILFTVYFRKKKNKAMVWELNYIFFHTTHDLNEY